MPTFTWIPDRGLTEQSSPRIAPVALGGYTHRITYGINPFVDTWSLRFTARTSAEFTDIHNFLTARAGAESFTWTTPQGETAQYLCTRFTATPDSCGILSISADFALQYELGQTNLATPAIPGSAFTWIADFASTKTYDTRAVRTVLGDGYAQRLRFGLNPQLETWNVTFKQRTNAERDAIRAFLRGHRGINTFTWTDPTTNVQGRYSCVDWSITYNTHNNSDLDLKFERVIEPLERSLLPVLAPTFMGSYTRTAFPYANAALGAAVLDSSGYTYHAMTYAQTISDPLSLTLTRRAPDGSVAWAKHVARSTTQDINAAPRLAVVPGGGGVYLLASVFRNDTGNENVYVHKMRFDGTLVWTRRISVASTSSYKLKRVTELSVNPITGDVFIGAVLEHPRILVLSGSTGALKADYERQDAAVSLGNRRPPRFAFDDIGNTYVLFNDVNLHLVKLSSTLVVSTAVTYTGTYAYGGFAYAAGHLIYSGNYTFLAFNPSNLSVAYSFDNYEFSIFGLSGDVDALYVTANASGVGRIFKVTPAGVVTAGRVFTATNLQNTYTVQQLYKLPGKNMLTSPIDGYHNVYEPPGEGLITYTFDSTSYTVTYPSSTVAITSAPVTTLPAAFTPATPPSTTSNVTLRDVISLSLCGSGVDEQQYCITTTSVTVSLTDATNDLSWLSVASTTNYLP